jgi:tyrosine-specific transport protein
VNQNSKKLWGGSLLIVGSAIGAGMLALPILTGIAGFFPSVIMFLCAWAFMTATGLLLVEAQGEFPEDGHFISMIGRRLGKKGRVAAWILYLFLFYALLVAYISASGNLFSFFSLKFAQLFLPDWTGSLLFVLLFGGLIYFGTGAVDLWNRFLVIGKVGCFLILIFIGIHQIHPDFLLNHEVRLAPLSLPILVVSFGFHNMVPSLTSYMQGNLRNVRRAILYGSLLTLFIYLLWQILVLGILPLKGENGLISSLKEDREAAEAVSRVLGASAESHWIQGFAFFAVLTSFLSQALSLVHFLKDGFKIKMQKREPISLCFLALFPPLLCSIIYPQLFFKALGFAGGICAVILFGILPALIVWKGRHQKREAPYRLKGGTAVLIVIIFFALLVLGIQASQMLGAPYLPNP